jgi:FlaA1/EpsC-like NDP-sugar epimerase
MGKSRATERSVVDITGGAGSFGSTMAKQDVIRHYCEPTNPLVYQNI